MKASNIFIWECCLKYHENLYQPLRLAVGLKNGQGLHHFLRESNWQVEEVKETRLWLTKLLIGEREIILMIEYSLVGHTTDVVNAVSTLIDVLSEQQGCTYSDR